MHKYISILNSSTGAQILPFYAINWNLTKYHFLVFELYRGQNPTQSSGGAAAEPLHHEVALSGGCCLPSICHGYPAVVLILEFNTEISG